MGNEKATETALALQAISVIEIIDVFNFHKNKWNYISIWEI